MERKERVLAKYILEKFGAKSLTKKVRNCGLKLDIKSKSAQLRTKIGHSKSLIPKKCAIAHKNWPFNKKVRNCAQKLDIQKASETRFFRKYLRQNENTYKKSSSSPTRNRVFSKNPVS